MMRALTVAVVLSMAGSSRAQVPARPVFGAFEVATVKPVEHDPKGGRYIKMLSARRFVAKDYTLKLMIAAAYDLNPRAILGGPAWIDADHYDVEAVSPGEVQPTRDEQMAMLRKLLEERFRLTFHREAKEFSIYVLEVGKGGPKLKESTASPETPAALISMVYPPAKIVLPARNATMGEFVSMLQRAMLDRPVIDRTGLKGRYDFDLEWAPDETQFGGEVPVAGAEAPSPPLFAALQQELGLRMEATRGPVQALVVDGAAKPSAD